MVSIYFILFEWDSVYKLSKYSYNSINRTLPLTLNNTNNTNEGP